MIGSNFLRFLTMLGKKGASIINSSNIPSTGDLELVEYSIKKQNKRTNKQTNKQTKQNKTKQTKPKQNKTNQTKPGATKKIQQKKTWRTPSTGFFAFTRHLRFQFGIYRPEDLRPCHDDFEGNRQDGDQLPGHGWCETPNSVVFFFWVCHPLFEALEPKNGWLSSTYRRKKTKQAQSKSTCFCLGGRGVLCCSEFLLVLPFQKDTWVCERVETLLKLCSSPVQDPSTVYTIYGIYYTKHPIYEVQVPENCVVEEDILKRFC